MDHFEISLEYSEHLGCARREAGQNFFCRLLAEEMCYNGLARSNKVGKHRTPSLQNADLQREVSAIYIYIAVVIVGLYLIQTLQTLITPLHENFLHYKNIQRTHI